MEIAVAALFVAVGIVNFAPIVGVVSAARLQTLYAVEVAGADLAILMRHRAVLLAIVGALLIAAAFVRELRLAAIVAGFASMLSFIALARIGGGGNAAIQRVARIDLAASLALAAAAMLARH